MQKLSQAPDLRSNNSAFSDLPTFPIITGLPISPDLNFATMNHEEEAVKGFILPSRTERYLAFLSSPKGRAKLKSELAHFKALNPKCLVTILPNQKNPASLLRLLASMGAGNQCWVISENSELDGREMDLKRALEETIGYGMGTIISCIPGKLGYFEDEDQRYILRR